MSASERFERTQNKVKRIGKEAAAVATVLAAPPMILASLLLETKLNADSGSIEFVPLERGRQGNFPHEQAKGELFLPYGSTAKVIFKGDENREDMEGLLVDVAAVNSANSSERKFPSAMLVWGRRAVARGTGGYFIEGRKGSVKIETTSVHVPELGVTLTHFRPPRPQRVSST